MTLAEFEEFVFGAVLLDWDAEAERMRRIADVFDAADEVRIVGSRHRPDAVARRAAPGRSTTGTSTCRAARSSTRRSRTRPKA